MNFAKTHTPLGDMLLVGSVDTLMGAWFMGQRHFPPVPPARVAAAPFLAAKPSPKHPPMPLLQQAVEELERYFNGALQVFTLPLDTLGTPFQCDVWKALRTIPYGQTRSYAQIAELIGRPQAVRPVGAAIGKNPLSIFIPCHRVLGKNGSLTGYAGGLDRKVTLLDLEKR